MSDFFIRHADAVQILIFAFAVSLLWLVEHLVIALPHGAKVQHTSINVVFILTALPAELVLSAACLVVSHWTADHHWGFAHIVPDLPWLRAIVVFVALDLGDYVFHRLMHHVPPLWRFHLVHHTDQMVDASTTVREHPGESIVRASFLVLWTFLLGASYELLLLRQAAETVSAILAHSALRLPDRLARALGFVFITPNLHHVHHHYVLPYTDRNFGGVFSFWDRLFGTFAELEEEHTVFGLDTHLEPAATQDLNALFAMPFAKPNREAAAQAMAIVQAGGSLLPNSSPTNDSNRSRARSALQRSQAMIASKASKVTWMSSFTST